MKHDTIWHVNFPFFPAQSKRPPDPIMLGTEPCARTAWHTHPLGQTLFVLSGTGLIGLRGESPKVINADDTVWIPPNEEHWHGATSTNSMCHIAMQEGHEGSVANWLEQVSEEDYKLPDITAEKVFGSLFA